MPDARHRNVAYGSLSESRKASESVGYPAGGGSPFHELNPRTRFAAGWYHDILATKLEAVRTGRIRRLIINMPPRHLKSHLASVSFPGLVPASRPERPVALR